jgi:hypothetical protein
VYSGLGLQVLIRVDLFDLRHSVFSFFIDCDRLQSRTMTLDRFVGILFDQVSW